MADPADNDPDAGGTNDRADSRTRDDRFNTHDPNGPNAWTYSAERQRFTVLRLHQQGGLGRLMIAQDGELNREIALKEILPAYADDHENRRRFVREAEITGNLEHPGIVPVYSLGEFADGRPYYAMQFVRGVDLRMAIEDYFEKPASRPGKELEFRQLLARFVSVCQAVDYAHSRNVIHRDLKPGNIMLGAFGETFVVDWGLAKTLDGKAAADDFELLPVTPSHRAQTDQTQAGRIVGTTQYMSPEQASGRLDQLTAASDVYGLGATLYHLLTGQPPFDGAAEDVVFRVQQGRFKPPREVRAETPRPLQAICLKAMARQPSQRYASARALALDVERYLADEPVAAHRESLAARSWRWVRRHRSFVTSASIVALLAIAGLTVGVGLLKVQRDRAERNFQLAQDAVRQYYIRVSEETLLNQPGMQPLRDALLKQALDYYQEFLKERGDDPQLQQEVAQAEFFVGRMIETIDAATPAIEHYERAAAIQQQLVAKSSGSERTELEVEYAQTLNALGRAHQNLKQNKSARQYFTQAAELREAIAKQRPDDAEAARTLASSLMNLGLLDLAAGDAQAAIKQLERAQTLRRAQLNGDETPQTLRRDLGMGDFNLAQVRIQQGDLTGAKQNLAEAIATFGSLATANHADFENSRRLALCQRMLGDVEAASGRPEEAVAALTAARAAMRELADRNPSVPEYAADLAGIEMNLGMQFSADGETSGALESLESAAKRLQTLQAAGDASPRHLCDLGVALRANGELLADIYRTDDARAKLQESQRILQELVEQHPNEPQFAAELKLTDELLAELDAI
ncbi:protein kinase domain-containing protein [Lacipirellula sp.]|uniref:serine/threonine-protein kinase n=1 Tax=Lacipirellula sp. TaxID=2691419 RepID=UPI003D0B46BE